MMGNKIPTNATLRDLLKTLDNPDSFVSRSYGVLHRLSKDHGEVAMRLGVTGTGQFPNYRVEDSSGQPILALNGANHEPWPNGEPFDGAGTWSEATMSKSEVEALLSEIRNFKRR